MTASARFLFFITVLTLVGCTPADKPVADPGSSQDASVEEGKEKTPASQASAASADETDLTSVPSLDLTKDLAGDLSPSELTPPESSQAEPALFPEPKTLAGASPVEENPEATSDALPLTPPTMGNASDAGTSLADASTNKAVPVYPEYTGLAPSNATPPEAAQPEVMTSPEAAPAEMTSPETTSSEAIPLDQAPMVPFGGSSPETAAPSLQPVSPEKSEVPAGTSPTEKVPSESLSLTSPEASAEPGMKTEPEQSPEPETLPLTPLTPAAPIQPQSTPPSPPESHANPLRGGGSSDAIRPNTEASANLSSGQPQGNELRTEEEGASESTAPAELTPETPPATELSALPASDKKTTKGRPNSKGQPFDPIKEHGEYFVGWPKPELALVMTGRQNGYIEPCGCAGMDRMKGGLTRRDTMIKDLTEKRQWPVVALDVGNQVKGHKRQTELKFQHTTETLLEMGYAGVGLGIADLQLPAGELAAITSNENSPFVSANIDLFEPGTDLIAKYRIVERNGIKVGITAVLGNSFRKQLNNKSIPTSDPVAAIQKVADNLKDCEVRVLLAYADLEESKALAKQFPMFNVVVTAAGGAEPPKDSVVIPGTKTYLVQVGEKGENVIVLGIYRDRENPVRYQRVTLDSRFATSEKIHRLMSAYQEQLKMLGLEGLNIKPVPCAEAITKGKYVGSKACATCHEQSYDIWRKSKHAHAWKTLVEADPPRNHDPECISCHVIGWDPQRYYPFEGGFVSSEKTPELENVGCESCHGPGGAHAKAEEGGDMDLQERLQKAMIVTIEESRSDPQKMCYNCHDLDNSPEFDFDKYWPEVKHYETESGEKEEDE